MAPELNTRDRKVLDFEEQWPGHTGPKESAIRAAFRWTPARYYQILNAVLDKPAALAHNPILVKRMLEARNTRTEKRASRTLGQG